MQSVPRARCVDIYGRIPRIESNLDPARDGPSARSIIIITQSLRFCDIGGSSTASLADSNDQTHTMQFPAGCGVRYAIPRTIHLQIMLCLGASARNGQWRVSCYYLIRHASGSRLPPWVQRCQRWQRAPVVSPHALPATRPSSDAMCRSPSLNTTQARMRWGAPCPQAR